MDMNGLAHICAKKGIYFSKSQAIKFLGSKKRVERLCIEEEKIRYTKGEGQNAKWQCHAEDVFNCM